MSHCGPNKLKEAAQYFERGGMLLRAIECYEQIGEWELLLHCLNRGQDQFGEAERLGLVNKYVPIALNKIYQQYGESSAQTVQEKNFGLKAEQKIQEKYKVNDEIQEEDLDEYGQELSFDSELEESDKQLIGVGPEEAKQDEGIYDQAERVSSEENKVIENEDENGFGGGFNLAGMLNQDHFAVPKKE